MLLAAPFFTALVATAVLWLVLMLIIRSSNFCANGNRRTPVRGGDKRLDQIEYHNNAIYRDFEFFFKISLAILGGVAFLFTLADPPDKAVVSLLFQAAGLLEFVAAVIFSLFIILHQKSKVERWEERYSWWGPFVWQEFWMIAAMLAFASAFYFGITPAAIAAIPAP